ncbi:DNA polymerase IV [Rhodococcus spelaei]|uniref:DNA polymerase IV n=1 Tax=Rhodococcus spelaei TaxID=2546320 RepID=A0A541B8E2_9NOCA|nr:DNA polymerase IV [Rhodococcus spelaei]TQF68585.1 DNA polymerase IV [Rhodococcus spelaei]
MDAAPKRGPRSRINWVLHLDLDQFVAAVEVLRRPALRGRPVIVGGRGDPTERAVVSTASYEAREFGIGSGMPLRVAARRLASRGVTDAVFLPVDGQAYAAASSVVMDTLRRLDAVVEVLGWDEAFLGVQTADPEAFARTAQTAVLEATALHCSVGIGDNKLRAKTATGFGKPRGMYRLTAENWFEVMGARDTAALWGIGTKTAKKLAALGIHTVRELADAADAGLAAALGPTIGPWLGRLGRGVGDDTVSAEPWVARSHSRETTFQRNLDDPADVTTAVRALAARVTEDLRAEGRSAVRVELKVRYAPFETHTTGRPLPEPTLDTEVIADAAAALTERLDHDREVRLLGVRLEMLAPP